MPSKKERPVSPISDIKSLVHDQLYINRVPSYGNKVFYSFGFLMMICFMLLAITGVTMVVFGQSWWLTNSYGTFVRSIHMWSTQALVLFLVLHVLVTFSTSAYRSRKFVWLIGSVMLLLIMVQSEMGYGIRGDFSSQWRALQGADFWNGSGLGVIINILNYDQVFGIHVVLIPFILIALIGLHFGLVRKYGIAKPYRKDIGYKMVPANHKLLYIRGGIVVAVILFLSAVLQSPFIPPVTLQEIATSQPQVFAQTLVSEFNHTSDTATYFDTIDPYTFDTRTVYVADPYEQFLAVHGGQNMSAAFDSEDTVTQLQNINMAYDYFGKNGSIDASANVSNPVIPVVSSLVVVAQSGLYGDKLMADFSGNNPTYVERFLADTGYMDEKADSLGISLDQYGIAKDEKGGGTLPPNTWWMLPLNFLDNTIMVDDANADRHGAELLGISMLLFAVFPWIPYANQIPNKLGLYKLFWKAKKKPKNR